MKLIYLADDDEDDTFLLKEAIKSCCGEVNFVCAINGAELLQNLKNKIPPPPDFLFLDLNMPLRTGHECLKEIKGNPFHKDLRVVIFTTSRMQSDIDKTYQAGADYYICKPANMKGYQDALNKLFNFKFKNRPSKEQFVLN